MNSREKPVILVVDDIPDNLSLMSAIISEDYRVKVASTGQKALEIAHSENPPDLILLDVMMPEMDGYEVCRRLKAEAETRDIPVIFVTALRDTEDERLGLDLGAADYIFKPINPVVVLMRIRTQLNLKAAADYLRDKNLLLEQEVERRTEEVKESYFLNQQIINSVQEGIVVHGRDLRYLVWNPFMEILSGLPASYVVGKHPAEIFPFMKDSGAIEQLEKAIAGKIVTGEEFPFDVAATGRKGWTLSSAVPLSNASGEIIGVIRTLRDITGQKMVEEQLRHSQKMEAFGQLAGGIAHDFNNILSVIMGYGNILAADAGLEEGQREQVDQIITASERAVQLTRGLLAFSRKGVMTPALVNLNDIVRHVHKFLVRVIGEDIRLEEELAEAGKLPVHVDSGQIEQVLINLATNARDAMPNGGILTIATGLQEIEAPLQHHDGFCEPGRYAWISVSDSGTGMDEETCRRIFEPFFTTKEVGKGTGLGMAIVFGIIRQHKGFITVESRPAQGTTFRILIPLSGMEPALDPPKKEKWVLQSGQETILLGEDDAGVRKVISAVLAQQGYKVIQAVDGEDAVRKFEENRDSIDMILMDMIMPNKNGIEAYDEICRIKSGVKILFSSGYAPDLMKDRVASSKGIEIVMKPVQPQELLQKIREMLEA